MKNYQRDDKVGFYFQRSIIRIFLITWLMGWGVLHAAIGVESETTRITEKNFTLVLKKDGTVWGWGNNEHGELGVGTTSEQLAAPIQIASGPLDHVVSIDYNRGVVTATRNDGSVWKSSDEQKQDANFLLSDSLSNNFVVQEGKLINHHKDDPDLAQLWNNKMFQKMQSGETLLVTSEKSSPLMVTSIPPNHTASNKSQEPLSISLTASGPYRDPARCLINK